MKVLKKANKKGKKGGIQDEKDPYRAFVLRETEYCCSAFAVYKIIIKDNRFNAFE